MCPSHIGSKGRPRCAPAGPGRVAAAALSNGVLPMSYEATSFGVKVAGISTTPALALRRDPGSGKVETAYLWQAPC